MNDPFPNTLEVTMRRVIADEVKPFSTWLTIIIVLSVFACGYLLRAEGPAGSRATTVPPVTALPTIIIMPDDMLPVLCDVDVCRDTLTAACAWAGRPTDSSVGDVGPIAFGHNNCSAVCKGTNMIAVMYCRERTVGGDL